jgi:hypothetical protein
MHAPTASQPSRTSAHVGQRERRLSGTRQNVTPPIVTSTVLAHYPMDVVMTFDCSCLGHTLTCQRDDRVSSDSPIIRNETRVEYSHSPAEVRTVGVPVDHP